MKRIAARKCCTIAEAVYWYNVVPTDDVDSSTAPANKLYNYEVQVLGIDCVEHTEAVDDDENTTEDVPLPHRDHVSGGGIFGQWRRGGAAGSDSAEEKRPRDATTRAFRTLTTV